MDLNQLPASGPQHGESSAAVSPDSGGAEAPFSARCGWDLRRSEYLGSADTLVQSAKAGASPVLSIEYLWLYPPKLQRLSGTFETRCGNRLVASSVTKACFQAVRDLVILG